MSTEPSIGPLRRLCAKPVGILFLIRSVNVLEIMVSDGWHNKLRRSRHRLLCEPFDCTRCTRPYLLP